MPESSAQIHRNDISIYSGELTTKCIVNEAKKIKAAFPALPPGFFDVFTDRLSDNDFCDNRLTDAVNHVIDTCVYPTPTIAQFISFDKRYKVYSYYDMVKMVNEFPKAWENFRAIKIPGQSKFSWVHISDVEKFNLKVHEI